MAIRLCILQEADFTAAQWTAVSTKALALRDLTNAQQTRIQVVYPGTAAQIAQAVMADILTFLRGKARNEGGNVQRATDNATLVTNQATHNAAFDSEWVP